MDKTASQRTARPVSTDVTADDLAKKELAAIYASGEPPVAISSVEMENWATLSRIRGIRIQEPVPYITTTAIWRILIYKMGQEKLGAFIDGLKFPGRHRMGARPDSGRTKAAIP